MKYKKLEITPNWKVSSKVKTKTFSAVKKAYSLLKKDLSEGTTLMADAWIKCEVQKNGQKSKKLKEGALVMAKTISSNFKKSFKGISPKTAVCDLSYELGGVIHQTKKVFNECIDDITRIPHGK